MIIPTNQWVNYPLVILSIAKWKITSITSGHGLTRWTCAADLAAKVFGSELSSFLCEKKHVDLSKNAGFTHLHSKYGALNGDDGFWNLRYIFFQTNPFMSKTHSCRSMNIQRNSPFHECVDEPRHEIVCPIFGQIHQRQCWPAEKWHGHSNPEKKDMQ